VTEAAYLYDPEKTPWVLRDDVERYRRNIEDWLNQAEANLGTHPYLEIHLNQPPKTLQPKAEAGEGS
jgi:hypothetical protein